MSERQPPPTPVFWLLVALSTTLLSLGFYVSWSYVLTWLDSLWQVCQGGLTRFALNPLLSWQVVVPLTIGLAAGGAVLSLARQMSATYRLIRIFWPLQQTPPERLLALLRPHALTRTDIVFLNLTSPHAFCLGFWRPRLWLTAGLLDLLTDDELGAVLAHEAHHLRQRDPLRLLISRALKSAFFFIPVIADLARLAELEQEVVADRQAIAHCGDDLPLLSALQKLLRRRGRKQAGLEPVLSGPAVCTPFNLTEARLRRLLYPPPAVNWTSRLLRLGLSLSIVGLLSSTIYLSCPGPLASQGQIDTCFEAAFPPHSSILRLN